MPNSVSYICKGHYIFQYVKLMADAMVSICRLQTTFSNIYLNTRFRVQPRVRFVFTFGFDCFSSTFFVLLLRASLPISRFFFVLLFLTKEVVK